MNRRTFLASLGASAWATASSHAATPAPPGMRLVEVTSPAGLVFQHTTGAFGAKYLPETLGAGCAFLDYDADGWQDILLVNGCSWPGHGGRRSTLKLYRNNRNGTFTDVTAQAGLDVEMYGMGVAVGDYDNDGFPDIFITCVGQNRLFRNLGNGRFADVTVPSGLGNRTGFSTSALWFDYDRDGRLDLFVCNYVRWSPATDVVCSDGNQRGYCTPEAYRGETCWLFRNRGNGTFEDVTATSGLFDASSKSLGVAMIDEDGSGWPDLFVANDTQPNKLYRNQRNGRFKEVGMERGVAFSPDGKARAGMGVDVGWIDGSGRPAIAVTNFDREMLALFEARGTGAWDDRALLSGVGAPTRHTLGFGCAFADLDLDGALDLVVVNGHINDAVRDMGGPAGYAQPPHLFQNNGTGTFRDVAGQVGEGFAAPKVARGLACGDFDNDGDIDLLVTTNGGPARLYRNDQLAGHRSLRLRLVGTASNRDAIGATVRLVAGGVEQRRLVKSGSSYLSQSELPVTFGVGRRDRVERVIVQWPGGRVEDFSGLATGRAYRIVEGRGVEGR